MSKEISRPQAGFYILVQLAGATAGVMVAHLMFDLAAIAPSSTARTGIGQWTGEVVASFGLVLTILGCLRFRPKATPLAVGLFITAGYWFTSSTSFANPAVTVGRAFTNTFSGIRPEDAPWFIIAQLVGAVLATVFARWLFESLPSPGEQS
jgi:glycerol uptake facilitator-like aquaporin